MKAERNLEIDRLRAIALIIILYGHFCIIFYTRGIKLGFLVGTSLLDIAFVISGFVISGILVDRIDSLKANSGELFSFVKAFYARRIYRIYPAALMVYLAVLFLSVVTDKYFSTPTNTLNAGIYLLTYSFNYFFLTHYHSIALAPYWTLMMEEQFYWLFPLFLIFTRDNKQRIYILSLLLILLTFFIRPISFYVYQDRAVYFSQVRFDGFIYGYFIYLLTKQAWKYEAIKFYSQQNWLYGIAIVAMFALSFYVTCLSINPSYIITFGLLIAFFLVLVAALKKEIVVFPFLLQSILDFLGTRFYSLYLIHVPAMLLAKVFVERFFATTHDHLMISLLFAFVFVAASMELLYRFIECPSLIKGRDVSKIMLRQYQAAH